jgi:HEAT repeat protein
MGSSPASRQGGHRLSLVLSGFLGWLLALAAAIALERVPLEEALRRLRGGMPPETSELVTLALVLAPPILAGVAVALLLAVLRRVLSTVIYARAMHIYTRRYLDRHGVLRRYGLEPGVVRFTSEGEPASDTGEPLVRVVEAHPRLLLLGAPGAGKTMALYTLAYEMSRRRWWLACALGRRPLPVLVALPGYASAASEGRAGEARLKYLAAQVSRFSTGGFARRSMADVRAGRLILLCDQMDIVPLTARNDVCAELASLGTPGPTRARMVIACDVQTYTRASQTFAPLRSFQRVVLADMAPVDARASVRQAGIAASKGKTGGLSIEGHRLDTALANPALLAAVLDLLAAGWQPPYGRGPLLIEYLALLCERAAKHEADVDAGRLGVFLGELAGSLREAGARTVVLTGTGNLGGAISEWLAAHEPITVNDHRSSTLTAYPLAESEKLSRAAISAGLLDVRSDEGALQFAHRVLEDGFAAWWLQHDDDGLSRIQPALLRPRWAFPVVLWSDSAKDPADVAKRLIRLSDTPDSTAARAGLMSSAGVFPATLALAIAAATEGFANALAKPADTPKLATRTRDLAQQHLRDLLDRAAIYAANTDQQARLARALQEVEESSGPELAASIAYLAGEAELNRLLRAQLIGLLGTLSSPQALTALARFLGEMDPVLRLATDQAFRQAGAAALGPLQSALATGGEMVSARAGEVLAGLGEMAVDNAISGLASEAAPERAASARALGQPRAAQAVEALITRLGDADSVVRIAAVRALGEIGGSQAIEALLKVAQSPDAALRAAVADALGAQRDTQSVPRLIELLSDPEAEVRTASANSLGKLGDVRAIQPLRERRDDPDPWAQHAVIAALRRLGSRP